MSNPTIEPTRPQGGRFRGIISALLTPLDRQDRVNQEALCQIVEKTLALGVDGFYLCGSTGEGFHLSPQERRDVVETAVRAISGRAFTMVNVSHLDLREMRALSDHAAQTGADAISSLPPLYYPYSASEICDYFSSILRASPLPMSLYHIPQLSHISMDEDSIRRLADSPSFIGVKFASEDFDLLNRYKAICGEGRVIWSARDVYYLSGLAMGAGGAIGSSFVFLGDFFKAITEAFWRGESDRALRIQEAANELHRGFSRFGSYQSYKRALELSGIEAGLCRRPFRRLPKEADTHLSNTLALLQQRRNELLPTFKATS